jgi:hypothetical protein
MEEIIRNVRDLPSDERRTYEQAVGHPLRENQQILLRVITLTNDNGTPDEKDRFDGRPVQTLEDYARVYEGLSQEEIEEIDKIINTRANLTRPTP